MGSLAINTFVKLGYQPNSVKALARLLGMQLISTSHTGSLMFDVWDPYNTFTTIMGCIVPMSKNTNLSQVSYTTVEALLVATVVTSRNTEDRITCTTIVAVVEDSSGRQVLAFGNYFGIINSFYCDIASSIVINSAVVTIIRGAIATMCSDTIVIIVTTATTIVNN